jgi:hypothetical protein
MADPQQQETFTNVQPVQPVETFSNVQPVGDQQAKADMPSVSATPDLWDRAKSFAEHPYENTRTKLSNAEDAVMGDPSHPLATQSKYGLTRGTPPAVAQIIGGPVMAPIHAAQAINEFAGGHPVKGINKAAQTVGDAGTLIPSVDLIPRAIGAVAGSKIGSAVTGAATDDPDYKALGGNVGGVAGAMAPELTAAAGPKLVRAAAKTANAVNPIKIAGQITGIEALKNIAPLGERFTDFGLSHSEILKNSLVDNPQKPGTMITPETAKALNAGKIQSGDLLETKDFRTGQRIMYQPGTDEMRFANEPTLQKAVTRGQAAQIADAEKGIAPPPGKRVPAPIAPKIAAEPPKPGFDPSIDETPSAHDATGENKDFAGEKEPPRTMNPQTTVAPPIAAPSDGTTLGGEKIHPAETMEPATAVAPKIDTAQPINNKPQSGATRLKENLSTSNETSFGGRQERLGPKIEAREQPFQMTDTNLRATMHRLGQSNQAAFDLSDPVHQEAATSLTSATNARLAEMANDANLKGRSTWKADDFKWSSADRKSSGSQTNPDKEALIGKIVKNNKMEDIPVKVAGQEGEQSRPFVAPTSSTTYGAKNRLVSVDEAAQAKTDFQNKLFRSHAGIDPSMLGDAAKLGAHHLEAGLRGLADTPNAPTFYSKAAKVAEEKIGGSGSGDQILSTLRNGGVKESEIKWMGLDDYLAGKSKVSKTDLQQFINDNQIHMEETARGGQFQTQKPSPEVVARHQSEWDSIVEAKDKVRSRLDTLDNVGYGENRQQYNELLRQHSELMTMQDQLREQMLRETHGAAHVGPTKFDDRTLPGEQRNYTEMMLRLKDAQQNPEWQRVYNEREDVSRQISRWVRGDNTANPEGTNLEFGTPEYDAAKKHYDELQERFLALDRQLPALDNRTPRFRSAHFEEPNILAHVRFNDRTIDGAKTLFLEEVQSDWHQQGKKIGYHSTGAERTALKQQLAQAEAAHSKTADARHEAMENFKWNKGDPAAVDAADKVNSDAFAVVKTLRDKLTGGVPNAPFKTDWHELAMKRMLRHAAEHGYDKLAWTTGDQQAARYDLSKHVGRLEYLPDKKMLRAYDPNGHFIFDKEVEPEKIGDYVGNEPARRLLESEQKTTGGGNPIHSIEGDGLKVGGEWAKALYDRAIPNFMNKYGKKWGASVGELQLPDAVGVDEHFDLTETSGGWRLVDKRQNQGTGTFVGPVFKTGSAAEKWLSENGYLNQKVHSVDITPAMKKSVLKEGQPISKLSPPPPLQPLGRADA